MKEINFLNNNVQKWKKIELILNNPQKYNPDEVANAFIELTDDLSFSRTYYPKSNTTKYINALSVKAHNIIYKNQKVKKGSLINFWKYDFPLLIAEYNKYITYSLIVFAISILIGVVSTMNDSVFPELILGTGYINMTIENIENGDPLAVYKQMNQVDMFLGITINNIKVAFIAFILGIFLSLGTVYILLRNGIMIGVFETFFYKYDLFGKSLLTVWIHGTFEIWAIVVAGAAGIILGKSFLFPETYSRLQSFKKGVTDGFKILVGLIPFFIIAGFLEGFITRYTGAPLFVRLFIILASLSVIIWYFYIYPLKLKNKKYGKF